MKRRMILAAAGAAAVFPGLAAAAPERSPDNWFPLGRPARAILVTGGDYYRYQAVLRALAKGLAASGVIENGDVPIPENTLSTWPMWTWLIKEAGGSMLQFPLDGWYDYAFNKNNRSEKREEILERVKKQKDVDIIFTMGTDPAVDMSRFVDYVPVMNLSCTDPVKSHVVASSDDSGKDNVFAVVSGDMWTWQLRRFKSLFNFKRLAIVTALRNKDRSGIDDVQGLTKELDYELVVKTYDVNRPDDFGAYVLFRRSLLEALDLDHCDAVYMPWFPASDEEMKDLLQILTRRRIPVFSQVGADAVRRGILMGVGEEDFSGLGGFEAKAVQKVLNGAKPRSLNMRYRRSQGLVLNLRTAMDMGWLPPLGLLATVEKTYETYSPAMKKITMQAGQ